MANQKVPSVSRADLAADGITNPRTVALLERVAISANLPDSPGAPLPAVVDVYIWLLTKDGRPVKVAGYIA